MHDISQFERAGLPAVVIASSEFQEAATAQGRALGFDPAAVFVPHPIQDRTDEEIRFLARAALEDIMTALTT